MHHPHPPAPHPGYLLQKIIAHDSIVIPAHCAELCLNDCTLTTLQSLCASGAAVCAMRADRLHLSVPVSVCACDACGRCRTLNTALHVDTALTHKLACIHPDARTMLLAIPCIRLLRADAACGGCFRVRVQIQLEIYLLQCENLCSAPCRPACPQLPLYPPPIC